MHKEIVVALIGMVSAVTVSYIASTKGARNTAREVVTTETASIVREIERLDVVTAGAVEEDGEVIRFTGYPFTVSPRQAGVYRINFRDPFKDVPVVVAISDGGQSGATVEVTSIDVTGFTVEGRAYPSYELSPTGFQFVAVHARPRQ